jgi:hypothetical protein
MEGRGRGETWAIIEKPRPIPWKDLNKNLDWIFVCIIIRNNISPYDIILLCQILRE